MNDKQTTISGIKKIIANFVERRDWEKFHSPKNLSMSIAIEAAELMEKFQWLSVEESHLLTRNKGERAAIEEEVADIAAYLIGFCNVLNMDLSKAVAKKLKKNSIN